MKTAVEWFAEALNEWRTKNIGEHSVIGIPSEIFEQAKEMEKEQIKNAYDAGLFDGTMDDVNDRMHKQYYNETFKSE